MAYVTATLKQKDAPLPDGRVRLVITFVGDAGEPTVDREHYLDESTTVANLRRWAYDEAQRLTGRKTVADVLTVGQSITLTAPPAPPAPTARQIWLEKAQRLARLRGLGSVTNSTLLTEINALADDVRTSYQAGWIVDA